jgi:hypothetical protein
MNEARRPLPVKLKLGPSGQGTIEVAGHRLENWTAGIHIISRQGELTQVCLEMIAADGLQVELEALVDVVIRTPLVTEKEQTNEPSTCN